MFSNVKMFGEVFRCVKNFADVKEISQMFREFCRWLGNFADVQGTLRMFRKHYTISGTFSQLQGSSKKINIQEEPGTSKKFSGANSTPV